MRKALLAVGCLLFVVGLVVAADTVTLVKYDKDAKEVTVKDDKDKEHTYKLTDKTKVVRPGKDGTKREGKLEEFEKMLADEKNAGKMKFDIEVKDGKITEVTTKRGGGKKDKDKTDKN
ncbi:MAG: hypothetical protein K2X87_06025 [Gemmataceae bacterium]|nr:hypothetical protein [Gemmataceae bacterium]